MIHFMHRCVCLCLHRGWRRFLDCLLSYPPHFLEVRSLIESGTRPVVRKTEGPSCLFPACTGVPDTRVAMPGFLRGCPRYEIRS